MLLNRGATLSAPRWNTETGRLSLFCSVYVHAENAAWLRRLLGFAVGLQAAEAEIGGATLPDMIGGEADATAHPANGFRRVPDDWINVIEDVFLPVGQKASPCTDKEIAETALMPEPPWILASRATHGLTAELPLTDGVSAIARAYLGDNLPEYLDKDGNLTLSEDEGQVLMGRVEADAVRAGVSTGEWQARIWGGQTKGGCGTALLVVSNEERHPRLGTGVLLRCVLPLAPDPQRGLALAHHLNEAEAREWTACHLLGAWCLDEVGRPNFVTFVPAAAYAPGLLQNLIWSVALRTRWTRQHLDTR